MILLYAVLSLLLFWLMGYSVLQIFGIGEERMKRNPLFPVLTGFCALLTIVMTLGLFIPIHIVVIIVIAALVVSLLYNIRKIYAFFIRRTGKGDKAFIGLVCVPIFIAGLPQILRNELYVSVLSNNDGYYYISAMDWLKNHTLLAPVEYSASHPFYSMANFMLKATRIGTDVTGACLMDVFHLEAHQAFVLAAVISIALIMIAVYEVISHYTDNQLVAVAVSIMAAVNGNTISLIGSQYVPQLFGMSLLLLSFYELDRLFREPGKETVILTGFSLSGLLATYCEFGVYVAPFILVYFVIFLVKRKLHILSLLEAAALTIVFNLFGFVRAVRFLLSIFTRVSGLGISDIDPKGALLEKRRLIGLLVGLSDVSIVDEGYYIAGIVIMAIVILCAVLLLILRRVGKGWLMFTVWAVMFVLYELYFRHSGGGYPEFKHVSSGTVFVFCIIGCLIAQIPWKNYIFRILQVAILIACGFFVYKGLYKPVYNSQRTMYNIDHEVMELGDAVKYLVDEDDEIEIDDSIQTIYYMGASYALRNRVLNLNPGGSSYLQFYNQFYGDDPSSYVVYSRGYEVSLPKDEEVLWLNNCYVLVKRNNVQSYKWFDITGKGFTSPRDVFVSRAAGYVQNSGNRRKFLLYGPYVTMNGLYDIVLEYTVLNEAQKAGAFQILSEREEIESFPMESSPGTYTVQVSGMRFDNTPYTEFRVRAPKGYAVRIDGLKYRRLEVE